MEREDTKKLYSVNYIPIYGDVAVATYVMGPTSKAKKLGQTWDAFHAWGKLSLVAEDHLDRKDELVMSTEHMNMEYKAYSLTSPVMPPSQISDSFKDLTVAPAEEKETLEMIRHKIVYLGKQNYQTRLEMLKNVYEELQSELQMDEVESVTSAIAQADLSKDSYALYDDAFSMYFNNIHKDPRLFDEDLELRVVPQEVMGGCLVSLPALDGSYVTALPTGPNLSELTLRQTTATDNSVHMDDVFQYDTGGKLYQICAQRYGEQYFITTRTKDRLHIFRDVESNILDNSIASEPAEVNTEDLGVMHMFANPYYPELVYATADSVYVWSEHSTSHQRVFNNWEQRFQTRQMLRTVHYGACPQTLVLTDPTACTLYDRRTKSDGVMLYMIQAAADLWLHSAEHLVTATQSSDPMIHHVIAAHTVLSIDERYPKNPLMYQLIPAGQSWLMLADCKRLEGNTDLLSLACPVNGEVFCMLTENHQNVFKRTPIWKCSETIPCIAYLEGMKKRLATGLQGLASTCVARDRFTVLMLSGCGDLFEQTYKLADSDADQQEDVTKAAGPCCTDLRVPDDTAERCHRWYEAALDEQLQDEEEETFTACGVTIDLPNIGVANATCPVCGVDEIEADNSRCGVCGMTPEAARQLIATSKDPLDRNNMLYCDFGSAEVQEECARIRNFDPAAMAEKSVNSELLYKLWSDEDWNTSLMQRDQLWSKLKNSMAASVSTNMESAKSSDFDKYSQATSKRSKPMSMVSSHASRRRAIPGFGSSRSVRSSNNSTVELNMDDLNSKMQPFGFLNTSLQTPSQPLVEASFNSQPPSQNYARRKKGKLTKGF